MTVMPAVAHNANESGFIIADGAAYAESSAGDGVYTGLTVDTLAAKFDNLRGESHRTSESLAIIRRLRETWATGANPLTAAPTAASA
jgi:hypothetical protein